MIGADEVLCEQNEQGADFCEDLHVGACGLSVIAPDDAVNLDFGRVRSKDKR